MHEKDVHCHSNYFSYCDDNYYHLGGACQVNAGSSGIYESSIMMFGEMCSGGSYPGSGTQYGQTIHFLVILLE